VGRGLSNTEAVPDRRDRHIGATLAKKNVVPQRRLTKPSTSRMRRELIILFVLASGAARNCVHFRGTLYLTPKDHRPGGRYSDHRYAYLRLPFDEIDPK
jgi:hypothetical protein